MTIDYINPTNMAQPRGYSYGVSVSSGYRTIYVGGQDAIDQEGNLVGEGDLGKQTEQALANVEKILTSVGAALGDVVKFTVYVLQGQNPQEGFQAFQQKWGDNQNYPALSVLFVAGLGDPGWLVEIEAIAVVPE